MPDETFFKQISRVLKKSRSDPQKLIELITCICDIEREGITASYKKIIRQLWPQEWEEAKDKVLFEKIRWSLLRKHRIEINKRIFESALCFSFYILLMPEKEFKTVWVAEDIYSHRLQELERALLKKGTASERRKIEDAVLLLNQKFSSREMAQDASRESRKFHVSKRKKVAAGVAALLLILAGFALRYRYNTIFTHSPVNHLSWGTPMASNLEKISIAVLPFENKGIDPNDADIIDGIVDEIILALSRFPEMEVIARSATLAYKDRNVEVTTVGKELCVQYIVEGSMRMVGDSAFLYVQISDTVSGRLVWGDKWDCPLENIFKLYGKIVLNVLAALRSEVGEGGKAFIFSRGTKNVEAYTKLMVGLDYFCNTDILLARQLSKEAVALDTEYAAAYALMAMTYVKEAEDSGKPKLDSIASDVIQKALALNDADPLVCLALSKFCWFRGEHDKALREAEKAVNIYPGLYDIISWYGSILMMMGDYNAAIEQLEKSVRLNPGNPSLPFFFLGYIYYEREDYGRATAYFEKNLQFKNNQAIGSVFLAASYAARGKIDAARAAAAKVMEIDSAWNTEQFIAKPPMGLTPSNPKSLIERLQLAGLP